MQRDSLVVTFLLGVITTLILVVLMAEIGLFDEEDDVMQYIEVRDFARKSFVRDVSPDELVHMALDGMLRGLDRYSRYYDVSQSARLGRETEGSFRGIGAVFQRPIGEGRVLYPLPQSPASRAGLRVGDRFLTLAGEPVSDLDEQEFRYRLSHPPEDKLEAVVRGLDGKERTLVLQPGPVIDPTVRHVQVLDPERGIGYLSISSFSVHTAEEFDAAFQYLATRGAHALVLDLRGNPGGVLDSAIAIARRFIPAGRIVYTEGRGEEVSYQAQADQALYRGTPMVVLVNGETASASEMLAGALQDHRLAVLVGTPTYGKGMVQTVRHFPRWGTRAKVTSSYYYSPSGRTFERSAEPDRDYGILPDVSVALSEAERMTLWRYQSDYGPPPEALDALARWEEAEGLDLIAELPRDPELTVALDLLSGKHPPAEPLD